ncbi:unnamed protein product, partial [Ectocarpus sp. 12 AP-2014]
AWVYNSSIRRCSSSVQHSTCNIAPAGDGHRRGEGSRQQRRGGREGHLQGSRAGGTPVRLFRENGFDAACCCCCCCCSCWGGVYSYPSVPYRSWKGPVEGTDKYDYRYTGRHDHGTLPALKTGGPHGELAKAILDAKADSDAFLTELINKEASARESKRTDAGPGGAAPGRKPGATTGEAMELEPCGAGGEAEASPQGGALPPTTPEAQPAKRPRP